MTETEYEMPDADLSNLPDAVPHHASKTCAWGFRPVEDEMELGQPSERDRRTYLGGHDVSAVLGWSSWTTRQDVWRAKVEGVRVVPNERMHMGLLFEDLILREFARRTGAVLHAGSWRAHPAHAFLAGTVDGFAVLGEDVDPWKPATLARPEGRRIIDAKLVSASPAEWLNSGVPIEYRAQIPPGTAIVAPDGTVLASHGVRVTKPAPAKPGKTGTFLNVRPSKTLGKYLVDTADDVE